MQIIHSIQLHSGSNEENLPGFTPEFPYIASRAELDHYREFFVPWHWHKAVELFYMESGEIRYHTPGGTEVFPAGTGGMVNSNVLHMTEMLSRTEENVQYLHIFDPVLIAGAYGNLIEKKYVTPLAAASQLELIRLTPDIPEQAEILTMIRQAFRLDENEFGYEVSLRNALSQIWLKLLELSSSELIHEETAPDRKADDKIKTMMIYIHDHFAEKISVRDLAEAAFLSERECYRVFQSCLHMTPTEYLTSIRLQMACRMLAETRESVTDIGHACGLGSSSYFGKTFREHTGYAPLEYRRKWQDNGRISRWEADGYQWPHRYPA
ncbi:helix-turn-helix transcriptional regulator [Mediterraneibacter glycyrrhizinilyticus]|uniref:AraC family transcriptional regulator n=1 Tax=Mediterraneibacter glycyrrhizinilyticus TaxID=342942 RepID=UPI00195FF607|nr:AraC family transcriptional regulator [Mediterraneibacter glycyrrhizinilyticus]MBM6801943.1 helix-turn-helix transcriptional regulator [Mediterraneibacter glycyrrhizinilyticus]MDM8209424.1 AraC family transcriptional regulator [Mediterraneibacter glycyrrhizinilyticus]